MESFSERYGFKQKRTVLQVDDMDNALRTSLWNVLYLSIWKIMEGSVYLKDSNYIRQLVESIWNYHLKRPLDSISIFWFDVLEEIRKTYFACGWYEVYDFIQYIAWYIRNSELLEAFTNECNKVLERDLSGYRFVGYTITPIISSEEIMEIEESLDSNRYVASHLQNAIDLLSDRDSPNYPNSIKESISAVEAMCALIAEDKNATLGDALSIIQRRSKIELHKSLRNAFDKLYGYTSDAEGIRHALLDESNLSFEDAKFMLVSCSAFINYLKVKASKAGIEIQD
ncbi:AbiJ-NTD4 domain-containing protein [Chloroflexota bacterium]